MSFLPILSNAWLANFEDRKLAKNKKQQQNDNRNAQLSILIHACTLTATSAITRADNEGIVFFFS
jgi:hypothetical protein